jgi:hypothetical protein
MPGHWRLLKQWCPGGHTRVLSLLTDTAQQESWLCLAPLLLVKILLPKPLYQVWELLDILQID